jgi:hypothetical protein
MRPLKRPQQYLVVRTFKWSPYLRGKPRKIMPWEVRRMARIATEQQARAVNEMMANVERWNMQQAAACTDPNCPVHHPREAAQATLQ